MAVMRYVMLRCFHRNINDLSGWRSIIRLAAGVPGAGPPPAAAEPGLRALRWLGQFKHFSNRSAISMVSKYSRAKERADNRCCSCGALICAESTWCGRCHAARPEFAGNIAAARAALAAKVAERRSDPEYVAGVLERKRATRRRAWHRHYHSRTPEQKAAKCQRKLARKHEKRQRHWVGLAVLGLLPWQWRKPKPPPRVPLTEAERALRRRLKNQRKWAKRKGAKGRIRPDDIEWLKSAQKGRCFYCCDRFGADGFHIDHFVPLARGGSNERDNLRLACAECNIAKSDRPAAEFMGMLVL